MAFLQPKKWMNWLSLAEWWYNTSYHIALQITPFQALYSRPPNMISEAALYHTEQVQEFSSVLTAEQTAAQIKTNLLKAQTRMKHYADKKRSERTLEVGDMVYLKLQPYRHTTLSVHRCLKLHSKYYGPFRIQEKIVLVAYKLLLPEDCKLHPTFHVSQLKKHLGPQAIPHPKLPLINADDTILLEPERLLERKLIPRTQGDIQIPVVRWLIKWCNMEEKDATWEDATFIQKVFPAFQPRGLV
ncbi:hypothetical protein VPH35_007992 [Triticum aestivum]